MEAANRVEIAILGPLQVRRDYDRLTISGARLRRLLLRLAVDAGSVVSAIALLDAVWPDGEPKPDGATNALQSLVSRLRRALADPVVVQQSPGGYRLAVDRSAVDAHRFALLAAQGRRQLRAGDAELALGTLDSALDLWQGNPLADADGAAYADAVVARLNQQKIQAAGDLFDAYIALGRAADVVAQLEELAAAELLQEAFTGQLMTALAAAGRSTDALAAYERLRQRLAEELGVDPDARLQAQHLALLRGEGSIPASPRPTKQVTQPGRTNIQGSLTSFIGRDAELERICELLDSGRLTTIVGPGGAGKTRLAAQAAAKWQERPAAGVWMIELAPVTEEVNIPQAVLSALGLREAKVLELRTERAARDSMDRLFESLEDAEILLIFDNCEHLIAAVADLLVAILGRCPEVKVLATSREPLGIVGESLCVIPPLGLPPISADAAEAAGYPAVRLLIERGSAVSAGFRIDEANVRQVVEIVRRLDGLPLAIELAAARLRVLPVAEIAARLGDRFRLLTGGNRTAMPRHQTLRAVVDWSWDLLTAPERLLAERLSVFPAGATEEAAVEICADGSLPGNVIPELLLSLVDKSLLQVVGDGGLRYRMLETIREYGVQRLAERAEADTARLAHGHYFAALAHRLEPLLRSRDQLAAIATLDAEQDNFVAALRFLGDFGDIDSAIDMALSLMWRWNMTESHTEIVTWMDFLLQLPGVPEHRWLLFVEGARALALLSSGRVDFLVDEDGSREHFAAIAERLETAPQPPWAALVIVGPLLSFFSGSTKRVSRPFESLLISGDPWIRAATRIMRAALAENGGDLDMMRVEVDAALRDFEAIGDRWGLSTALNSRAWIRTVDGDPRGAIADYEQAISYLRSLGGGEEDLFLVQLRLGGLRIRIGDLDGAQQNLAAVRGDGISGPHRGVRGLFADGMDALLHLLRDDASGAAEICDRMRSELAGRGSSPWMRGHVAALTLSVTAAISLRIGDIDQAAQDLTVAYAPACETRDQPIVAGVGVGVAGLAMARGRWRRSASLLGASARLRGGDDFADPTVGWIVGKLRAGKFSGFDAAYQEGKSWSVEECLAALDPAQLEQPETRGAGPRPHLSALPG